MSENHNDRRVTPAGRVRLAVGLLIFAAVIAIQLLRSRDAVEPIPPVPHERIEQTAAFPPPTAPSAPTASSDSDTATSGEARPAAAVLTEQSDGTLQSPAGLLYERGSAEGHRLDHIMRHAEDMPSRPIHGVFDGGRDEIIAVIDEAWQTAQTRGPPTVITEQQGDRTVYTVDLGRRIGYVGGRTGQRQNHPPARHLKLVLEDQSVITAYPLIP